ncbi:phosphate ABC transporter ATP-binding protein PstB [Roseimicrobium sp. ORNL1]|uniref:phosphate ABC transporter ATP-binding protein PstB n=1 Tax=Roseimicrobium sp. ORNL1 TaxID=2711231 RepID=UPI0013E17350|nr:phosphate ABC transporter ATP-binding protein PstB [Roseimicrobium sp. ORNL1]QIF00594.1 phosphate ABC transporter ATP-binding protein [Roseimicrobium sp. ORNL1]
MVAAPPQPRTSSVDLSPAPSEPQERAEPLSTAQQEGIISVRSMDFMYGTKQALFGINLEIPPNQVTAFIGPSGCGKSTLLRCFNRINDRIPGAHIGKGKVIIKGKNIYDADVDTTQLRRQVGMVFQKYNPFPKSIYENVVYGLRIAGEKKKSVLDEACERALREAALWDETKDRLKTNAFGMSGGQMQRLCIARAVAVKPDILLMDEPCSALDPIATLKVEELIVALRKEYTVVIVTHNMQQARRVADLTAFMYMGNLIEFADTVAIFSAPQQKKTEDYIRGQFS